MTGLLPARAIPGQSQPIQVTRPVPGWTLITNDKFCLTRSLRLRLSWPRARGPLRPSAPAQLSSGVPHRGEEHAASAAYLARPAHGRADGDRPAALGPGLPASPAVGGDTSIRSGRGAGAEPAGDAPCA